MKKGMTEKWIFLVSFRYLFTKRREKGHVSSLLSVAGITLGVVTLIIVLSVMNGFQHNYIDNINEVISYHLRLDNRGGPIDQDVLERVSSVRGIEAVLPFIDFQTTLKGDFGDPAITLVRGLPPEALETDPSLARHLAVESGRFDLVRPGTIVLGAELAMGQGIFPGDRVTLSSLAGEGFARLALREQPFLVTGTVRTGYKEYDRTLAFISLESARTIMGESHTVYGIKTSRINRASAYGAELLGLLPEGIKLTTWADYNRAFFEALRMEKVMMFLVVSLVFLVVAVNIYHSLKRSVSERIEEIALLKSVGAAPGQIRMIFLQEGLFISLTGIFIGMVLGVILANRVNQVFSLVETLVNGFLALAGGREIAIYSPRQFYLMSVPVLIMVPDLVFIGTAALALSLGGAWVAAGPVAKINPAEVLNSE